MTDLNYEFVMQEGCRGIRCLRCGKTSYHAMDIAERYCVHCHYFHEDANQLANLANAEREKHLAAWEGKA